jgi:hypothetical protein
MVRRRGIQLLVMAVLGLVLWTFAGSGGVLAHHDATGVGFESTPVAALSELGSHAAIVRTPHDRTTVVRAQRLMALVAVLVVAGLVAPGRRSDRTRLDDLPVWSGWFNDPGLLRGPPTT